jgi:hypothetical protein
MAHDFQSSGCLVTELNEAQIRTLQLDDGIEYLVQDGRQIRGRGRPRAQHIRLRCGRRLGAHARTHLAVTERSRSLSMIIAHHGLRNACRELCPRRY